MIRSCWATTLANVAASLRPVPWCTATRMQRCESGRLGLPVADDRQRADHQVRAGQRREVGERGRCLAEAHVVGQASAEPEPVEELQPAETAALIWAQRRHETRRLDSLGERGVGKALQQIAEPAGGGDRRRGVVGELPAASSAAASSAASRRRSSVDSSLWSRRCSARLARARRASVRSRRTHRPLMLIRPAPDAAARSSNGLVDRSVVDHDGPVDDRRGAEPAAARSVLRLGDALGGCRSAGEAFGCEQFDVDGGQRVDRFERGCGGLEIDTRLRIGEPRREPRGEHLDVDVCGGDALGEHRQEPLVAGEAHCAAGAAGDVGCRAPPSAIIGVDQLERQRPVAERFVGQCQSQSGPHDRLALGAADGLVEDRRQIVERLTELGVGSELAGRRAEGPSDGPGGARREAPGVGDRRVPAGTGQQQARRLIDERIDDHGRQFLGGEAWAGDCHHGRLRRREFGNRTGQIGAQRPPAGDPPSETRIRQLRQDAAGGDESHRHRIRRAEPTDRRPDLAAEGVELTERGQRGDGQALAHHLLLATGQCHAHDAHRTRRRGRGAPGTSS